MFIKTLKNAILEKKRKVLIAFDGYDCWYG